jgi:intracellular multiplication protein IcmL
MDQTKQQSRPPGVQPGGRQQGAKQNVPQGGAAARQVTRRNDWYKDLAKRAMSVAIVSQLVGVIGIGVAVTAIAMKPEAQYFATDNGRIIPVVPVSQPLSTPNEVTNWTVSAVTQILGIDFLNYRDQLAKSEGLFTKEGFESYLIALRDSGNLDSIQSNRHVVKAVANGAPRIVGQGPVRGVYSYQMQIPLTVTYHGSTQSSSQRLMANVLVMRVSAERSRDGIAIQQLVFSQR